MTFEELLKAVEAAERAERVKRGLPPDHLTDFAHFPFAFALGAVADFDQATAEWQTREPNAPGAAYYRAMAALAHRDYAAANRFMAQCAGLARDDGRERMRFGLAPEPSDIELPPVGGRYPDGPALFLSCDRRYLKFFCLPMLRSIADKAPSTPVHVHLMDKDADAARALLRTVPLKISFTYEDADAIAAKLGIYPGLYCGAARFVRFAQALDHSTGPLWISDVDGIVTADPAPLFALNAPLAMRVRAGRLEPFHQYSACLVMGTPASRPYFKRVADIIMADLPTAWWGLDQYALFSAAIALEPSLALLGPDVAAVTNAQPGLFWYTGGKAKTTLSTDQTPLAAAYRAYATPSG